MECYTDAMGRERVSMEAMAAARAASMWPVECAILRQRRQLGFKRIVTRRA